MALGTIQTGTGLITGMDISGTVDKLIALAAKPRDLLKTNTETITAKKTALTTLSALFYAIKVPTTSLAKATTYSQRTATSSNPAALAATISGTPALGTYEYTPLRLAQSQKTLSTGFASDTASLGKGSFTVRFGDRVDRSVSLSALNGGQGFVRGSIRITDRNGDTAEINLSAAQTIDDVLEAINSSESVAVTATTVNGRIHLTDTSDGSGTLSVQDIGNKKTATSLGLAGISSTTGEADGQNIYTLSENISLNQLNDGIGFESSLKLEDIKYKLHDGTEGKLDFAHHDNTVSLGNPESTLQQLMDVVKDGSYGKMRLEIAADGTSLKLVDLTEGPDSFSLQSIHDSPALHSLGLDVGATADGSVSTTGNEISGRRILGGLKTVSIGSLDGGKGFGALGAITITDRSGANETLDLQSVQTLDDLIAAVNSATNVHVRAQINQAGNGIEITDLSGSSSGSLAIADADATNTATKLKIKTATGATNVSTVKSGDMHLKVVGENTLLSTLNGGAGVAKGKFTITDSKGKIATIDLTSDSVKTVGDVIRTINRQVLSAQAELNDTGDGIILRDYSGGGNVLTVAESGGTTAKGLGLLRTRTVPPGGGQEIDGSMTYTIDIYDKDSLQNINSQINALGAGFVSSIISDGSATPYHLSIASKQTGKLGAMVIDTSGVNFSFEETAKAQDALLLLGTSSSMSTAIMTTSSTNTFSNLTDGLKLTLKQATGQTVSVSVDSSNSSVTAGVKVLVENYNKFIDEFDKATAYDAENDIPSALTGDGTALQFQTEIARLFSDQFYGVGDFTTLVDFGITFNAEGKLEYDETQLQNALGSNPDAVKEFFTNKDYGFSKKVGDLIENLAGADKSTLSNQLEGLDAVVENNNTRIDEMNARLEKQKEAMLLSFYYMELAVGRSQDSLKALEGIAWMSNGSLFSFTGNNK
jgi:flagellar hook-associated protein 2